MSYLTRNQVATTLGISKNTLFRWERRADFPLTTTRAPWSKAGVYPANACDVLRAWRYSNADLPTNSLPAGEIAPEPNRKLAAQVRRMSVTDTLTPSELTIFQQVKSVAWARGESEAASTERGLNAVHEARAKSKDTPAINFDTDYPAECTEPAHQEAFNRQYDKSVGLGFTKAQAWDYARKCVLAEFALEALSS